MAIVLFLVAVVSVIVALVFLSKASFLQIKEVDVLPASTTALVSPADEIQKIAEENLVGSNGYFFSKSNFLIYPKSKITADIIEAFPRIQSVDIYYKSLTTLGAINIAVTERTPYALACTLTRDTAASSSEKCFFMDATGFIYAPAPQFSAGVYVRYYTNESSTSTVAVGNFVTTPRRLTMSRTAVDFVSKMGIQITRAILQPNNEYTLVIKDTYATSTPKTATSTALFSTIYFNGSTPVDTALSYFLRFWQSRTNRDFDYIDLRYGKDIVFKMH